MSDHAHDGSHSHSRLRLRAILSVGLVVAAALSAWLLWQTQDDPAPAGGSPRASQPSPPWPAPADPKDLVAAAGLDLGPMGMAEHYHPELAIEIDDEAVQVPTNIGIDPMTGAMSALHTHSADGVIHVEADRVGEQFTLGQLFTQWDVHLTRSKLGGVSGTLTVTVNGSPYGGDPAGLVLAPEQRVVLSLRT